MPTNKYTEYLDPLGSMATNNARRGFLALGRYHGFDSMSSAGGLSVNIEHANPLSYVNHSNTLVEAAVFITGHGVVITTDIEPQVTIQANVLKVNKYQILYAEYTWADSASSSSVSYGIGSPLSTEPEEPTGMTPVQTPLGYFTVPPSATYADLVYTPYAVPNLTGKPSLDLSGYATLAGPNQFTGRNSGSHQDLELSALVPDSREDGSPYFVLQVTDTANTYIIPPLASGSEDPTTYYITEITIPEARTIQDGELLTLYFEPSPVRLQLLNDNNIRFPYTSPYNRLDARLNGGTLLTFRRINSAWQLEAQPHIFYYTLISLSNRITTNEAELSSHNDRLLALESNTVVWSDIVSPGSTVGAWVVNYLRQTTIGSLKYVVGQFTADASGDVQGATEITSIVLGADKTLTIPHHWGGHAGIHEPLGLRLDSGDDTVKLIHGIIPSGIAYIYTLPATIIS